MNAINQFLSEFFHISWLEFFVLLLLAIPTVYAMLKGAPFVPSSHRQVKRMLEALDLKPGMKLYDIGCGDGRFCHHAAKEYKLNAVGYEYSPFVWLWAQMLRPFYRTKAKIKYGNFWRKDLSDADVIVCYLLPEAMANVNKKIIPTLKKGTFIVSNAFSLPELETVKVLPRVKSQRLAPVHIYKI